MKVAKKTNAKKPPHLRNIFIPRPGIFTITLLLIHIVYSVLYIKGGVSGYSASLKGIASILGATANLLCFALFIESLGYNRILRNIFNFSILFFALTLYSYNLSAKVPADVRLIADNARIAFSREAFSVILSVFSPITLIASIAVLLVLIGLEIRFRIVSGSGQEEPLLSKIVFALTLWISFILIPLPLKDQFTQCAESFIKSFRATAYSGAVDGYPYMRNEIAASTFRSSTPASARKKPNVFIIMIESFNANFVEKKNDAGIEHTPFFNELIKKGIYVERFYGNSIQTCKGQESVFFSIIPSINGKLFVSYPDLSIEGFPALLSRNGYRTIFFQAYHDLTFDNTDMAMKRAGFSVVDTFARHTKKGDSKNSWGWGIEDATFYERFFEVIDDQHTLNPDAPVFASLATVGTHIPCEEMPADKMFINKNPKNIRERYENALHLSDSQLEVFFNELKKRQYLSNSIVIITSDHSFPMREHGFYNNELGHFEESFRIPLLIIWNGVIAPQRIADYPMSQIDIGPTILDCIGICKAENTLQGTTLFLRNKPRTIHLVQPYNGRYLEAVMFPYKYVLHEKTEKEEVYDLKTDPGETKNIVNTIDEATMKKFRAEIEVIRLNQKLIEENRIYIK
jgi:arylsulfatase A-like enzyme